MIDSNVSPGFWAEAISTANHVCNQCPSASIDDKTPFQLWTGHMSRLNYLRSFGCKAIALNKNPTKGKFKPRGRKCIFISYSDISKAYCVWYPSDHKVEATRDVVFLKERTSNMKYDNFIDNDVLCRRDASNNSKDWTLIETNDSSVLHEGESEPDRDVLIKEAKLETLPEHRGPGRPRIVRTGLPGRPRKAPAQARKENVEDVSCYVETHVPPESAYVAETPIAAPQEGPDVVEWRKAIKEEFYSHIKNETWNIIDRPTNRNIISCKMVLRNKYDPDGNIERRKVRLVARGFGQKPDVDFRETFAPVARMNSIRMVCALAVQHKLELHQLDVTTAYLNGIINEEIYMEIPELLEEMLPEMISECKISTLQNMAMKMLNKMKSGEKVCILNKAIYGLKQAGRQWHLKLRQDLQGLGMQPLNDDTSVYTARRNEKLMIIVTYVDNLIIACNDRSWISEVKSRMKLSFHLRNLGRISHCLGFEFDQTEGRIFISPEGYAKSLLRKFGMDDCNPVSTLIDIAQKLNEPNKTLDEADYPFRELIGGLMYLSVSTRPDISYAVNSLSQFNNKFGKKHWSAAKRILRYLKGTLDYGLMYTQTEEPVCGYVNADWAGCVKDRKSYTGYLFKIANAATSWESRKQQTVALSSTEAEYMALANGVKKAMHVQRFVSEVLNELTSTITIYNDNQGSQKLAKNPVYHWRTKHIDVKHHFVREAVENNFVDLRYMPTKEMPADILTKGMPASAHRSCVMALGVTKRS